MSRTLGKWRSLLLACIVGVMAIAVAAVIQAPMKAQAAGWDSSLTISPAKTTATVEYGQTQTLTVNVTSTEAEGVAMSTQSSGIALPGGGFSIAPESPQTLVFTLNPQRNLNVGNHKITVRFMPQENRASATLEVDLTVTKAKISVTSGANVSLYYGQTVNAQTTNVQTDKGAMSLASLGLTNSLLGTQLEVGTYNEPLTSNGSGNYEVSGTADLAVTVNKTAPTLTGAKGSNLTNGSQLKASTITGSAVNPYTNAPVAGTWSWMSPEEKVTITSGTSQTQSHEVKFTPTDQKNYIETRTTAGLIVMSSSGPSSGDPTNAADPQLKVTGGSWTYDRTGHGPNVSKQGVGNVTVTYTNKATGATTTNPPVDVGTYTAKVTLAPTVQYRGAEAETTIVINQRLVNLKTTGDAIQSRPYNGTREATVDKNKILISNYFPEDNIGLQLDRVEAVFHSANVGDYVVLIQCPGAKLTGDKAGNYKLNTTTVSEKSTIFKRPAKVNFMGGVMEKEYGETFTFGAQGTGYTIEQGTVDSKSGVLSNDMKSINLTSPGAAANAAVGTYSVTALGAGANYDLQVNGSGTLKVKQATPYLMSASAGSGKIGAPLSSIQPPTVTYVNNHNGEAVPDKVTWTNPNQTIGTATTAAGTTVSYGYTFTPNNQGNYKVVTGTVNVTATAKTPVSITTTRASFTYDGLPHEVSHATNTAGATIKVTYKVNDAWQTTPPTNVGAYEYRIVADMPDSAEYADNEITGTMTISPLTPTGQPKVSGDGETLSAYKLDASTIIGIGGKAVSGAIAWDNPSATVKAGDKYAWTFTSSDPNYSNAKGTIIPKALDSTQIVDKTKLQSALANANRTLSSATVSSNGLEIDPAQKWVTNAVNDVLLKAINSANNCLTEGGATQKMVDEAIANLNTAINSFNASMQAGLKGTDQVAVDKMASTIDVATNRYDIKPGDNPITIKVGGEGDGAIFAFSDNDSVASAVADGNEVTVTPVMQGTAYVTINRAATETYEQASKTVGIIVGEAPADYVAPTEEGVDTTKPVTPAAADPIIRVYNPNNGEHLYVKQREANVLATHGWKLEPGAKVAETGTPVYRLLNEATGEHHYTMDANEYKVQCRNGWKGEGVQFYSDDTQGVKVYRLWSGSDGIGSHLFTSDANEYRVLLKQGWKDEGAGWYYVK